MLRRQHTMAASTHHIFERITIVVITRQWCGASLRLPELAGARAHWHFGLIVHLQPMHKSTACHPALTQETVGARVTKEADGRAPRASCSLDVAVTACQVIFQGNCYFQVSRPQNFACGARNGRNRRFVFVFCGGGPGPSDGAGGGALTGRSKTLGPAVNSILSYLYRTGRAFLHVELSVGTRNTGSGKGGWLRELAGYLRTLIAQSELKFLSRLHVVEAVGVHFSVSVWALSPLAQSGLLWQ